MKLVLSCANVVKNNHSGIKKIYPESILLWPNFFYFFINMYLIVKYFIVTHTFLNKNLQTIYLWKLFWKLNCPFFKGRCKYYIFFSFFIKIKILLQLKSYLSYFIYTIFNIQNINYDLNEKKKNFAFEDEVN